jgi:hypothetical protein
MIDCLQVWQKTTMRTPAREGCFFLATASRPLPGDAKTGYCTP